MQDLQIIINFRIIRKLVEFSRPEYDILLSATFQVDLD
jgi:hypothetical protein